MNPEAENFLEKIQQRSVKDLDHKFRIGNAEHGNDFFNMTFLELLQEALQENTDQRVFLYRLIEMEEQRLRDINSLVDKYSLEN